jgi:hypothetical protein
MRALVCVGMSLRADQLFAYVKASRLDGDTPAGSMDLLARPFVGDLIVTLAHDVGDHFEILQRRHLAELGLGEDEAFALGLRNLEEQVVDAGKVRVHVAGTGWAVIAGGNFEASLLLLPSVWSWVTEYIAAPRLLAAAPDRELVMLARADDSAALPALDAFLTRAARIATHPLTDDLYLWDGERWSVHRRAGR